MRYASMLSASLLAVATLMAAPIGGSAAQHTTGDKVEKKAEKAERKTKGAVEDAKTGITDTWLTAKTKIALYADDRIKGTQVNVATTNGVVTLRGKVDSEEAKNAAADVAKGIEGVKSVKNDLQVVPPPERKAVDSNDKDIAKRVEERLSRDARLKKIDVRSDAGVVTLTGEVPNITVSARASEAARQVPGVRSVKNDLTMASTSSRDSGAATRATSMRSETSTSRQPGAMSDAGERGTERVKAVQEALKDKGHDPGPIDGIMGPQTASALREYQKQNGLAVTGRADSQTTTKLGVQADVSTQERTGKKKPQSP